MRDIGSILRSRWVEVAWAVFALANLAVVFVVGSWETIPFHLIWVSLTIVYGFRVWSPRATATVLVAVMASTGAALWLTVPTHHRSELAEVPLMAAMFLAMVWHARRRQAAVVEASQRAESERAALERERSFVRDASHELRTPITIARGHAELVRASSDGRTAADADVVIDELDRLARLSDRLLQVAAGGDTRSVERRDVHVSAYLSQILGRWRPAAPRRWVLDVDIPGTVSADPDRLGLALDALLENAVHATSEDDRIELRGVGEGSTLTIEVADTGVGIAPGDVDRMFERFARVDAARSRHAGGTGLGLAVVRAVAEAHGGTAELSSHPGEGTVARIRIPGYRGRPADAPDPADGVAQGFDAPIATRSRPSDRT
jgi:signal transduction histidine kinase